MLVFVFNLKFIDNFVIFQGTFSLIVEAWHDTNDTSRSDGEFSLYVYYTTNISHIVK